MRDENSRPDKPRWLTSVDRRVARMQPERRRLLLRLAGASAALIALVALPGYAATRPNFIGSYDKYEQAHATWSRSEHAAVSCQKCHVPPSPIRQTRFAARMTGEFYLRVIPARKPVAMSSPKDDACSGCHVDLRTVSPAGDLRIPHRAHVQVLKVPCVRCHSELAHASDPEFGDRPKMEMCLECHDGKTAKNACAVCHTEKAAPDNHRASDWTVVHSKRQKEIECAQCHAWKDEWCADCHARRPRSHKGLWRTTHRESVDQRRNCEACHPASFCVKCHGQLPRKSLDPSLKLVQ